MIKQYKGGRLYVSEVYPEGVRCSHIYPTLEAAQFFEVICRGGWLNGQPSKPGQKGKRNAQLGA